MLVLHQCHVSVVLVRLAMPLRIERKALAIMDHQKCVACAYNKGKMM